MTASDGTNPVWQYAYSADGQLSQVTRPDGSAWVYADPPLIGLDVPIKGPLMNCVNEIGYYKAIGDTFTWSATHPSGATGTFNFRSIRRGRSYVPFECFIEADPAVLPDADAFLFYPPEQVPVALTEKKITGAGVDPHYTWNYSYSEDTGCFDPGGGTDRTGIAPRGAMPAPYCTSSSPQTVWTDVTAPDGSRVRRTFGNRYEASEGQLLAERHFSPGGSSILQLTSYQYLSTASGQPFPNKVGTNLQVRANTFLTEKLRPQWLRTQQRQGVSFTEQIQSFDLYTNPTQILESSSVGSGYSRTRTLQWFHQADQHWVLNQLDRMLINGVEVVDNQYFGAPSLLLQSVESYGRLHHSCTHHGNGLLHTVTDGRGKTTTLSNYHRGIPQLIQHPDSTTRTAVVNNLGQITSLTDEANFTTGYSYDTGGRLSQIRQPPGNGTGAWTATQIVTSKQPGAEFGIAGNRWRQTISTGNRQRVIDYDVLLRPILVREYDAANAAGTLRALVSRYDEDGRVVFASYPQRTFSTVQAVTAGTSHGYDGLGRKTFDSASSELGALNTSYQYLNGFRTQVTNPRGFSTTTEFQAYADPGQAEPVRIDSPEGVTTLIARDVYGKPTSMTRNAVWAGLPITSVRRYVYDIHQRLCKTIEPETGATVFEYDLASNVVWSAAGLSLPSTSSCDQWLVGASGKVSQTFDDRNRPLVTSYGDGSPGVTRTWTADGLPATVNSGIANWTYTYNDRRLLTREQLNLSGVPMLGTLAPTLEVNYQYNALGDLSSWDYPGSGTLALNTNALGQPTQLGSYATGIAYHANGQLANLTYGNGIIRSVTLNARQLPQQVTDNGVMNDQYVYDGVGNITRIWDQYTSDNFMSGLAFGYDGRDRLIRVVADRLHTGYTNVQIDYTYDGLDNLRTFRSPPNIPSRNMDYVYNSNTWRLTRIDDPLIPGGQGYVQYQYDSRGNAIDRGAWGSHVIDLADRLRSMTGQGVAATYDYDGHRRRVLITEPGAPRRVQFHNSAGLLLAEIGTNSANTTTELKTYFYQGRNLVAERLRTLSQDTTNYVHSDHLGSPVARTNTAGYAYERTMYEPYGLKANSAPNGPYGVGLFPDGIGFAGHRVDRVSGLSYMQQRYYDPVAGRFISPDPVPADAGALFNRYAYAYNNPVTLVDTDGRLPIFIPLVAAFGIGAGSDAAINYVVNGQVNYTSAVISGAAAMTGYGLGVQVARGTVGLNAIPLGRSAATFVVGNGTIAAGADTLTAIAEGEDVTAESAALAFVTGAALSHFYTKLFNRGALDLETLAQSKPLGLAATIENTTNGVRKASDFLGAGSAVISGGTSAALDLTVDAATEVLGNSDGFQGVFRVEGRVDAKRLDQQ